MGEPHSLNQRTLKSISRAIAFSEGEFSLILLRCNYQHLRKKYLSEIQKTNSEIVAITLEPQTTTLYSSITEKLAGTKPSALIVLGLEDVIKLEDLLTSANQIRDEFRKQLPFPIALWVNDQVLTKFIRYAPDFTNWAVTPLSFELDCAELIALLEEKVANIFSCQQLQQYLTVNPLSEDTKELNFLLEDLKKHEYQLHPQLLAKLEFVFGSNAYARQELEQALQHYQKSLEFWHSNHDFQKQGLVFANIALCYCRLAERQQAQKRTHWQSAWAAMEQALNYLSQANCPELISQVLSQQGEILQYLQEWDSLQNLAERARPIHETYGKTIEMAQDYGFLAMVAIAQSRWQDGIKLSTQALEHLINEFSSIQDHPLVLQGLLLRQLYRLFLVKAYSSLGKNNQAIHNLTIAKSQLDVALTSSDHRADPQQYLDILKQLRDLYFDQGCYLEAFHIKQQQLSVEQLYGFRAFIGARRLQPQPTHGKSFPTLVDMQTTVAAEIRVSSRYQDLQNLLGRLGRADHRLIVLHGESGVGKSSLIHGGLIPVLQERGVGDRRAVTIVMQVYTNWVRELFRAFNLEPNLVSNLTANLDLIQILDQLRKQEEQHCLTVIIFDQFEEFFFHNTDNYQRNYFFAFLRDCLNISYVKVIISLREDGLHYLLHSEQTLLETINNNILDRKIRYPLGNFSISDTQAVITTLTKRADFELEPDLVNEIVAELAVKNQEIRPIELQLVGTQIQSENITTLEQYHQSGLKQRLVERFLEQVVQDCGAENEVIAWQVLYFLTAENDIRPLKTRLELVADLELEQGELEPTLDLILEILEKSGLVFLLPEIPFPRYQLVHDYLVNFIRQQEEVNTRLQIEDYKQQQISNQETIERLEFALREKALIAELTIAKLGQQDSENKLNQILQQRLTGARLWGLGFLTMAMLAGVFAIQASLKETNAQIGAIVSSSESLILSNRKFDALISTLKAGRALDNFWGNFFGANVDTNIRVVTTLQQALGQIRESNRLEGHTDWVMGVVFAPNGQVIATASKDKTIKLWSPQGQLLKTLTGHQGEVYSVAFSPDSQVLVSGGTDKIVKIWNYGTGKFLDVIGHQDTVSSVIFSPDGQLIATASWDKTIRIWTKEGKFVATLTGHSNRVLGIDFSPDGNFLVSAGADGKVIFWGQDQKGNWQFQQAWQAPGQDTQKVITSIKFAPNNQKLAITGTDGRVSLWQRDTIALPWGKQPDKSWQASNDWVLSVAFSPDGQFLATGNADNTVQLWDLQGKLLDTFRGHGNLIRSVAFSPDGQTLSSGSGDSTVKLWRSNPDNQKIIHSLVTDQPEAVNSVSFSPDGETIATAGNDRQVRLWIAGVKGYSFFKQLSGHSSSVNTVIFSHQGKLLATGGDDRTVRLWTNQGDLIRTITAHEQPVTSIAFSGDDGLLVTGSQDKTAKVWNTEGTLITTLGGHQDRVNTVAFTRDGDLIATGSDDQTVKLWRLDGQLVQTFAEHNGAVNYVAFSADGRFMAVATNKGTIKLWNLDGTLVNTLRGHNGSVNWVGFSPDGQAIASVSEDKTLKFWRLDGTLITTLTNHSAAIFEASFSQNKKLLATAGQDGKVVIWNLDLPSLINQGCNWLADYQRYNSNAEERVCDR